MLIRIFFWQMICLAMLKTDTILHLFIGWVVLQLIYVFFWIINQFILAWGILPFDDRET